MIMTKKKRPPSSTDGDVKKLKFEDITPKTFMKNNMNDIALKKPEYKIEDVPIPQRNRFLDIKNEITNLEIGKCITISNKETGFSVQELQQKISMICHLHRRKFINKKF